MKASLLIIFFGVLFTLPARAQEQTALRNDPTYSTHNYKHPNKAAMAQKWGAKKGVAVPVVGYTAGQLANYKQQRPSSVPVGGLSIPYTPSTSLADRNYKIQRIHSPRQTVQPDSQLANKPLNQSTTDGN